MRPYYEHGGITIYHGDCREIAAELAFDVICTDPPYGTGQKNAYRPYKDTMDNWIEMAAWLCGRAEPTAFTLAHTRLWDLPKRPQWIGCWDKVFTGGIVHVGASPSWEPIIFYNLPPGDRPGGKRWDDVFRCTPFGFPFANGREFDHPCPKPTALYRMLLGVLPTGMAFDPFCGTGATLRAAKDMARPAVGCDVSERYCEMAAKRLQQEVLPLEMPA